MKLVNIRIILDPASSLETDSLAGHLCMIDDNRLAGSLNEGTNHLATAVMPGDQIVWTVQSIECEAYLELHQININPEICTVQQKNYSGTSVTYWTGTVKAPVGELPYGLVFEVGSKQRLMSNDYACRLIDAISTEPVAESA